MTDQESQYGGNLRYAVDIVLCIDITMSMHPVLDGVKSSALSFHDKLTSVMAEKGKSISQLRVKVIAFRDFGDRADDAIEETGFLALPGQSDEYQAFVRRLEARGGGDAPESGLEALALAIRAPWERGLDRRRHVIVMFTDAPAHTLEAPTPGFDARPPRQWPPPRRAATTRNPLPRPRTICSRSGGTSPARRR